MGVLLMQAAEWNNRASLDQTGLAQSVYRQSLCPETPETGMPQAMIDLHLLVHCNTFSSPRCFVTVGKRLALMLRLYRILNRSDQYAVVGELYGVSTARRSGT